MGVLKSGALKPLHDLRDDLIGGLINGDADEVGGGLKRGELAVEEGEGHEVTFAGGHAGGDELACAIEEDEGDVGGGIGGAEAVAVDGFERGAGDDVRGSAAAHVEDSLAQGGIPWPAVFVGERGAGGHFGFVGGRVEVVAVVEGAAELGGECLADE